MKCSRCQHENPGDAVFLREMRVASRSLPGLWHGQSARREVLQEMRPARSRGDVSGRDGGEVPPSGRRTRPSTSPRRSSLQARPRRRAQAGHRALRRREGLDGAAPSSSTPRSGRRIMRALLPAHPRRASSASRASSTSSRATASWRSSARRSRTRTTPQRACYAALQLRDELVATRTRCDAGTGLDFSVAHRYQLRRGRRRHDRRRPAHGLHGAGAHRRPRARMEQLARAGHGLSHRRTRAAGRGWLLRARRSRPVRRQGRAASRSQVYRARRRLGRDAHALRRSRSPRPLALRRARRRDGARSRRRSSARAAATARSSASSPRPGTGKSRLCYEFVERCRARGLADATRRRGVAHGKTIPFLPMLRAVAAPSTGSTERDSDASRRARRSPAACCCSTSASARSCRSSSTSSACPTRASRRRAIDPEARQRQMLRHRPARIQARAPVEPRGDPARGPALVRRRPATRSSSDWSRRVAGTRDARCSSTSAPSTRRRWMQQVVLPSAAARAARPARRSASCCATCSATIRALAALPRIDPRAHRAAIRSSPRRWCSRCRGGQLAGRAGAYRLVTPGRDAAGAGHACRPSSPRASIGCRSARRRCCRPPP